MHGLLLDYVSMRGAATTSGEGAKDRPAEGEACVRLGKLSANGSLRQSLAGLTRVI